MDLTGRPLLDTRADAELFVDRDVMDALERNAERGLNTLLVGERGAGKTTLLRRLAYRLREPGSPAEPVYVEGGLARDAQTFVELVRYRLGLRPSLGDLTASYGAPGGTADRGSAADSIQLLDLVRSLAQGAGEGRRVILVDHLPSPPVAHTLFGRLRDEVWQLPFTWIVAAEESERGGYLAPPADAFFDVVLQVPPLTEEEQRRLLEKRIGRDRKEVVDALVALREGNPRRLLGLAREAIDRGVDPGRLRRALTARDGRVGALGRSARMVVEEMEALGPVSASDDRLLDRLGWTRERAVQVLRKLEEAGIVESSQVKGPTGRPRKVYRLRDPVER